MSEPKQPGKKGLIARSLRGATAGAIALLLQGVAPSGSVVEAIIDRARQRRLESSADGKEPTVEQLVMQPADAPSNVIAGHSSHRSHSSHSSHGSHSSHYSGSGTWTPPPPQEPAPEPKAPPPPREVPKPTTLQVKATPQARVFVDGKPVGTTPTPVLTIEKDTVEVVLEHRVHGTTHRTVTLQRGAANVVDIVW